MDWLLAPIDAARPHDLDFYVSWHGRLMVLAWGVAFPIGIMIARFFKITPGQDWPNELDNTFWWRSHLSTQYSGGALMAVAFVLIWLAPGREGSADHHMIAGYAVLGLGVIQFITGWLRGSKGGPTDRAPDGSLHGDHYDMTRHRRLFEHYHKTVGYALLAVAFATVCSGMWAANAVRWMWVGLALWWGGLAVAFAVLQRKGYAVDTYQAIWGADKGLPGNKIRPIGWGVRRR